MKQSLYNFLNTSLRGKGIYVYNVNGYLSLIPSLAGNDERFYAVIDSITADYDNAIDIYFRSPIAGKAYINVGLDEEIEFVTL